MLTYRITPKHATNMTRARLRVIELRALERPPEISSRDFWTDIYIRQHSPFGVKEDNLTLFMAYDRHNSWHVSNNGLMLMKDDGLVKMGNHRFAVWMAKEKLNTYGRLSE
jgi:hypothetical protein